MSFYDKYLGSNSKIGKAADKVGRTFGGGGIIDYAGGKGTKKDAAKSALRLGANLAAIGTVGTAARGLKALSGAKKAVPITKKGMPAAKKIAPRRLPYGGEMVTKAKNTSGKLVGKMKIEGQKKAVKVYRRYTQGFD